MMEFIFFYILSTYLKFINNILPKPKMRAWVLETQLSLRSKDIEKEKQ